MSRACAYCGDELCLTHCIYCLTDCSASDPEHGPACPSVTGRYPVRDPRQWDPACDPACCGPDAVKFCCRCEKSIEDFYYLVLVEEGAGTGKFDAPVYESVCFECKVAAETTAGAS